MLFKEIHPAVFEKNKTVRAHECSAVRLMSVLNRNEQRDIINSFTCTAKTHSTIDENKFIRLYAEHLHFLIKKAGWLVTSIYEHFTFEQSRLKKDFVIMKQKARQKATSPVEQDLYKLLNNSIFRID